MKIIDDEMPSGAVFCECDDFGQIDCPSSREVLEPSSGNAFFQYFFGCRRLSRARLPLDDDRLSRRSDVNQNLAEVRCPHESELWNAFGAEDLLNGVFQSAYSSVDGKDTRNRLLSIFSNFGVSEDFQRTSKTDRWTCQSSC